MKKVLSVIFVLTMILSVVVCDALVAAASVIDNARSGEDVNPAISTLVIPGSDTIVLGGDTLVVTEGYDEFGKKWKRYECNYKGKYTNREDIKEIYFEYGPTALHIGHGAFAGCTNLEKVVFKREVFLEQGAFYNCTNLTEVVFEYPMSFEWTEYVGGVSVNPDDDDVTCYYSFNLNKGTFEGCERLKNVNFNHQNYMESWDPAIKRAFQGCTSLEEIILPQGVPQIGSSAFWGCTSLKNIEIPESINAIEAFAFDGCKSLKNIEIPKSVVSIGSYAFYGCTSLKNIEIPESVVSIESNAFYGCTSLSSIDIPESVAHIGVDAFGYHSVNYAKQRVSGFTVYGYGDTAAEAYAKENDFKFVRHEKIETILLTDNDTMITVALTVNADLIVKKLDASKFAVIQDEKSIAAYDISLTKEGEEFQPEDTITVSIPTDNESAKVYRVEKDNTLTEMDSRYENGYLIFDTDHFSVYLLTTAETGAIVDLSYLGDTDGDGEVTIIDATAIQRHLAALPTQSFNETAADADKDGEVTIIDATAIQRHLASLPTQAQGIGEPIK